MCCIILVGSAIVSFFQKKLRIASIKMLCGLCMFRFNLVEVNLCSSLENSWGCQIQAGIIYTMEILCYDIFLKAVGLGLNKLFQQHFKACAVASAYSTGVCRRKETMLLFALGVSLILHAKALLKM